MNVASKKGVSRKYFVQSEKILKMIFTVIVLSLFLLSGPARAITLGITNLSSSIPSESGSVSFLAKVDVHTDDRVPLTNLTVNVKYSNDSSVKDTCTFDLSGSNVTSCSGFTVSSLSSSSGSSYNASASGYAYGYGYDSVTGWGNINESFGYGYASVLGYGYDSFNESVKVGSGSSTAEFVYNVTWTTPAVSSNTTFDLEFSAVANDGTSNVQFQTKTPSEITVVNTPTTPTTTVSPSLGGGTSGAVYSVSEEKLEEGFEKRLQVGSKVQFAVGGESHSLQVKKLVNNTVTVEVSSAPQTATLSLGEEKRFELTGDDYYDLIVKFERVMSNRADLTIRRINEKISRGLTGEVTSPVVEETSPPQPVEDYPLIEEKPGEQTASLRQSSVSTILWILGLMILAIFIITVVLVSLRLNKYNKEKNKIKKDGVLPLYEISVG